MLARFPGVDIANLDSGLAEHSIHRRQLGRALLARRDAQAADLAESHRLAEKRLQLAHRLARAANHVHGRSMKAAPGYETCGAGGGAGADVVSFQDEDIGLALQRQMPCDAAPEDASAHDRDGDGL